MARDCPFLVYESNGWFSGGYICKKTQERIRTGDLVYTRYCHDYEDSYSQCPHFGPDPNKKASSSYCFLTTACTEALGLPDDCRELTAMRRLRDAWLAHQPGGKQKIEEYYATAPAVVTNIHAQENCADILRSMYFDYIIPCTEKVEARDFEAAYLIYCELIHMCTKMANISE